MTDPFDPNRPDAPHLGLYMGVVIDRDDPEKLYRVRVTIPGFIEDEGSAWAFPLGLGGGAKARGMAMVPPVGADVGILFKQGDIDQPYYLGGHWGRGEQLTGTEGEPDAPAIETERYLVVLDDREESPSLTLKDKISGDVIQMNGTSRTITIEATTELRIKSQGFVRIDGLQVIIQGIPAGFGQV